MMKQFTNASDEQVAAARLRVALDSKFGRATPDSIWRLATTSSTSDNQPDKAADAPENSTTAHPESPESTHLESVRSTPPPGDDNISFHWVRPVVEVIGNDQDNINLANSAEHGNMEACVQLGGLLASRGHHEQAQELYRRAAATGHAEALTRLGDIHAEQGRHEEAEEWYKRAAATGQGEALARLGDILTEEGRQEEAEDLYRMAAKRGFFREKRRF